MKLLAAFFIAAFIAFAAPAARATDFEALYQHDMDIARLNDVRAIGALIEEYKSKTGQYPLMTGKDIPAYAHIATKEQRKVIDAQKGPPYEHVTVPAPDFIALLEKGLGRPVEMPFDPQRAPSGRQHFYSYMVTGDRYFLGVHLYGAQPFAQKIRDKWYKVEISNRGSADPLIWDYEALMADTAYKAAAAKTPHKPGYVEQLRAKLRTEVGF
jgi:hypothetical protein